MTPDPRYPDISDVLARKAQGRLAAAQMPFGEKLAILDRLKAIADEFRSMRERNNRESGDS